MQQQVIELGKSLIKELNVEPGSDTLTRWMAHYIADLLIRIESCEGDDKVESQSRCFEAILTLWHHRSFYTDGHRPFENFQPIFRLLDSLSCEDVGSYYFRAISDNRRIKNLEEDKVQEWVDFIARVDEIARILIVHFP